MYGLDGTKPETLTGHYFGFRFKWQSFTADAFLPNILAARLVEHVEEHGESIVKPDLTGPIWPSEIGPVANESTWRNTVSLL